MKSPNKQGVLFYIISFILFIVLVGAAYYIGRITMELKYIKNTLGDVAQVPNEPSRPEVEVDKIPDISDQDYVKGNDSSNITLISYSDFECPFCSQFHTTAAQAVEAYGIKWALRHFPLKSMHPDAQKAAEASECVGEIGGNDAFWNYADTLYENQSEISETKLLEFATQLGIDGTKFSECLESDKYADKVSEHMNSAMDAGIGGTPASVLVNSETNERMFVPGAVPIENLNELIDAIID